MAEMRSRIKAHVRVRAGDLVPHELNPRTHSDGQRAALAALYDEVGFARSLLAYEVACAYCRGDAEYNAGDCICKGAGKRLKLIDGHLRASMDVDSVVDVEVLDVDDDEARKLLLSIDPLAQLAGYGEDVLDQLRSTVATDNDVLADLWASVGSAQAATEDALKEASSGSGKRGQVEDVPEQFCVLVQCKDEKHQLQLLKRFKAEGLKCKTLIS